jgi:ribosomal-protein-alanine N-acetyltransferase
MYNNWASDPEVTKYLFWEPHADIKVTEGVLANWDKKNASLDYYHWGIVFKETEQIIGTGGIVGSINEKHQSADLGYCISRPYWGQGFASEAIAAMIAYLFNTVGLNRITASHDTENVGSGRVMQKCGMTFEGIQRQAHYCVRRGFYDSACYAILKTDFEKNNNIT